MKPSTVRKMLNGYVLKNHNTLFSKTRTIRRICRSEYDASFRGRLYLDKIKDKTHNNNSISMHFYNKYYSHIYSEYLWYE